MAVEKIVTLCKEGDSTTEYYPNIKADNIPVNAVAKGKLTQALQDEIDAKAPQLTTYTKTEVDNKLSGKVNVATYNAKVSELENAIDDKADADDVYTKTATDTLLDAKANSSDVFTKAETNTLLQNGYYNQTEIDLMLENKADADNVYTKTATDTLLNGKQDKIVIDNTFSSVIGVVDSNHTKLVLSNISFTDGIYVIYIESEEYIIKPYAIVPIIDETAIIMGVESLNGTIIRGELSRFNANTIQIFFYNYVDGDIDLTTLNGGNTEDIILYYKKIL